MAQDTTLSSTRTSGITIPVCRAPRRGLWLLDWCTTVSGIVANLSVTVPANSSAKVHIPVEDSQQITESGLPCSDAEGVNLLRSEKSETVVEIGSGVYRFSFPAPYAIRAGLVPEETSCESPP